jgi:hypothetical protein
MYTSQKTFENATIYVGTDCSVGAASPVLASANGSVPDFKQRNPKWASIIISGFGKPMSRIGCAITSLADVLAANGVQTDPGQLVNTANQLGIAKLMKGSDGLYAYMAKKNGLIWSQLDPGSQWDQVISDLKSGSLVIANGKGPAPFTDGGHYVVFTSYNSDGTITVNDPYRNIGPTNYSATMLQKYSDTYGHYISIFSK